MEKFRYEWWFSWWFSFISATSTSPWSTTFPSRWHFMPCSCFILPRGNCWGRSILYWNSLQSNQSYFFRFGKVSTANIHDYGKIYNHKYYLIPLLNQTSLPIKIMFIGVMLAILEHLGYILPVIDEKGKVETLTAGSIAAGYQNFLICIEMFFAAIALKYAFPISVYIGEGSINAEGRSVTMQSISSSLKVF